MEYAGQFTRGQNFPVSLAATNKAKIKHARKKPNTQ